MQQLFFAAKLDEQLIDFNTKEADNILCFLCSNYLLSFSEFPWAEAGPWFIQIQSGKFYLAN